MVKVHRIWIDFYRVEIHVIEGKDIKQMFKFKGLGEMVLNGREDAIATVLERKEGDKWWIEIYLTRPAGYSISTLVHELIHVKNIILDRKGIELSMLNDEHEALFTDRILQYILEKVKGLRYE